MKIVMTVNAAWNIWNFRKPLVARLLSEGHEITVLAPRDESAAHLEAMGCAFRHLEMSAKGLNPLKELQLRQKMLQHLREVGPDVVLSYTIKNNIFGALAAKKLGLPFIPNITGLGTAFLSSTLLRATAIALYKAAFYGLPIVFFQNQDDRDVFLAHKIVTDTQACLLPGSGIDLKRFACAPYEHDETCVIFLMISRVLRHKGVLEFVEAARSVRETHPHVRFQLLGPTDAQNRTAIAEREVKLWGESGWLEYLGVTDDVRPFIARSHCLILPSYREGAPRTLIEGAAMGRPLITTDVPGCRTVVEDGSTGFLCQARCGTSLTEAVLRFLALRPQERAAMGAAGRKKMEREFDDEIVGSCYAKAIADVSAGGAAFG